MNWLINTNTLTLDVLSEASEYACQSIKRYNDAAGRKIDPKIRDEFLDYMPKGPITLYRGMGFAVPEAESILKKLKLKPEMGSRGVYPQGKVQSWTSDPKIAEEFAGLFVTGGVREHDSLGIIVKATIHPESIIVPIDLLPHAFKTKCIRLDQKEYLIGAGKYPIEIIKLIGAWPQDIKTDPKKEIKDAGVRVAKETDGLLRKNWNKSPGFAIDYPKWSPDGKFLPSIQFFVKHDYSCKLEKFALIGGHRSFEKPAMSKEQFVHYLKNDFPKDFKNFHDEITGYKSGA